MLGSFGAFQPVLSVDFAGKLMLNAIADLSLLLLGYGVPEPFRKVI